MHAISTTNNKSICSENETLYVWDFHIKSAFCLCLVLSINIKVKLKVDQRSSVCKYVSVTVIDNSLAHLQNTL